MPVRNPHRLPLGSVVAQPGEHGTAGLWCTLVGDGGSSNIGVRLFGQSFNRIIAASFFECATLDSSMVFSAMPTRTSAPAIRLQITMTSNQMAASIKRVGSSRRRIGIVGCLVQLRALSR